MWLLAKGIKMILWKKKMILCCCLAAKLCLTLCDPMDCSPLAPLCMGFPRQEHWRGLLFASPGDLPDPGIKPESLASPALEDGFFTAESPGKPQRWHPQFFYSTCLHFMGKSQAVVLSVNVWLKNMQNFLIKALWVRPTSPEEKVSKKIKSLWDLAVGSQWV